MLVNMRVILNQAGMSSYEEVQKYDALLQSCLTCVNQGQREGITLNQQQERSDYQQVEVKKELNAEKIIDDVLKKLT